MADLKLTLEEAHVMRGLISNGHDHCVPRNPREGAAMDMLTVRGWLEHVRDHFRLTTAGRAVTLRDLRDNLTSD